MGGKDPKGTPGWGGQVLLCWVILGYLYTPCLGVPHSLVLPT